MVRTWSVVFNKFKYNKLASIDIKKFDNLDQAWTYYHTYLNPAQRVYMIADYQDRVAQTDHIEKCLLIGWNRDSIMESLYLSWKAQLEQEKSQLDSFASSQHLYNVIV